MLVAIDENGNQAMAWKVSRGEEYFCPECRSNLVLRKGEIKVHHFAHKVSDACDYGAGESEDHRRAKFGLYESLQRDPQIAYVGLEERIGQHQRADVFFVTRSGEPVAIEMQRSNLSVPEIQRRTLGYTGIGVATLWVALGLKPKVNEEFRVREWQVWMHAMWQGRVFTHIQAQHFAAWKFDKVVRAGGEYYIPGGEGEMDYASDRTLRRTKTLRSLGNFDLVSDFEERIKWEWKQFPRALIWDVKPSLLRRTK